MLDSSKCWSSGGWTSDLDFESPRFDFHEGVEDDFFSLQKNPKHYAVFWTALQDFSFSIQLLPLMRSTINNNSLFFLSRASWYIQWLDFLMLKLVFYFLEENKTDVALNCFLDGVINLFRRHHR